MIPLELSEIARLTGGHVEQVAPSAGAATVDPPGVLVDGPVVTDSRLAGPGSLFVARVGEHADGHDFVPAAADRGAVAALASRPVAPLPCVVVPDVQAAFGRLARGVLSHAPRVTVVGVTGSSGKTTTKDLLGQVLGRHGPTVSAAESLNGEVGVPLTVCRVTRDTRYLVVEMGARGIGHIRYLTTVAPPAVGVVLNVGAAHVGEFGSRERTALAKGELVEDLPKSGVAVLNADDPAVAAMATRTAARVVLVGEAPQSAVRAVDTDLDDDGRPTFRAVTPAGEATVALALRGQHQVSNALAVLAVALEAGMALDDVVAGLEAARPVSRWRMQVSERPDGVRIVNDAYNANPDSTAAALHTVAAMSRRAGSGRTWAVLGEMLELGEHSRAEHARIGALAAQLGITHLVAVGAGARALADGARREGAGRRSTEVTWLPDADAAYEHLQRECRSGDVVLLKSSRDVGLRWLGERLAGEEAGS